MNILLRELKAQRKSLIIWCLGMLFTVAVGMAKFAGYADSGQSINDLFKDLPPEVQSLVGTGTFDLSTAAGFYGVLFLYLVVLATVHASIIGANLIAKEELDKTTEFLFVKPVSRHQVITAKLLAGIVNLMALNIVALLASIMFVGNQNQGEPITGDILKLMIGMFILQLIYMCLGAGLAAAGKNPRTAASTTTGIVLITFILSMVIDINDKLANLKYLTPYKYFDAKNLMFGGNFDPIFIILSALLITILLAITYTSYQRRDLNI